MSNDHNMTQQAMDDEIDLLELGRTIWAGRKLIAIVTFSAAVLAVGISLLMPNIYRAEVLMVAANKSDGGGKAGALMSQFGGLASLAGISIGSSSSDEENLAVLNSRTFLWDFVQKNNLMPILFEDDWDVESNAWKKPDPKKQPSLWDAYRLLDQRLLSVTKDKKTNLITVAVEWTDAEISAQWANELVEKLNDYLRQQAIQRSQANLKYLNEALGQTQVQEVRQSLFDMIAQEQKNAMIASTQKEFAFRVLDVATAPDKKIKPKRSLIVILAAIAAGFVATLYVFVMAGMEKRREQGTGDVS